MNKVFRYISANTFNEFCFIGYAVKEAVPVKSISLEEIEEIIRANDNEILLCGIVDKIAQAIFKRLEG